MQKLLIIIVIFVIGFFFGQMKQSSDKAENTKADAVALCQSSGWYPITLKPNSEDENVRVFWEKTREGQYLSKASYPEFPGHANGAVRVEKIVKESDGWKAKLCIYSDGEKISEIEVDSKLAIPVSIPQPHWAKTNIPILVTLAEVNDGAGDFFVTYHK